MQEPSCVLASSPPPEMSPGLILRNTDNQPRAQLPACSAAAAATAATAKAAEAAAETPTAAKPAAAEAAAERTDAAVPATPWTGSPWTAAPAMPRPAGDGVDHDEQHDEPEENRPARFLVVDAPRRRARDVRQDDVAPLGNSPDDPRRARQQPGAVLATPELRRHVVAADFARESIGDELLEVIADFHPDFAILHRQQDEQ